MKVTFARSALAILFAIAALAQSRATDPQFAHMVYFKLKESTGDAKEKLVVGCKEFLSEHEGTVYFAAGVLAEDMKRDVNDRDFDVSLHIVFKNKAAHDKYHSHPRHTKFIEEYSDLWEGVRVFDSYLASAKRSDRPEEGAQRIPLPDPAAFFAGMIKGKVVAKRERQVVVLVDKVTREWRTNRAKDSRALVGKRVLVASGRPDAHHRFVAGLEVGKTVELDVAHKQGEVLTILELTAEQRERYRNSLVSVSSRRVIVRVHASACFRRHAKA